MAMPSGSDTAAYIKKMEELQRLMEGVIEDSVSDLDDPNLLDEMNEVQAAIRAVIAYLKDE